MSISIHHNHQSQTKSQYTEPFWFKFPTHNALLWGGGDYVADVKVLGRQFAVETQEVAEPTLDRELVLVEGIHRGLQRRGGEDTVILPM